MHFLMVLLGIALSDIAFADQGELINQVTSTVGSLFVPDSFIATYVTVMGGLRIIAEGGGYIADKTHSKWDNKFIQFLAKGLNSVSWLAGIFGVGTPKNTKKPIFKRESK